MIPHYGRDDGKHTKNQQQHTKYHGKIIRIKPLKPEAATKHNPIDEQIMKCDQ